jgi:hypothetical protein
VRSSESGSRRATKGWRKTGARAVRSVGSESSGREGRRQKGYLCCNSNDEILRRTSQGMTMLPVAKAEIMRGWRFKG